MAKIETKELIELIKVLKDKGVLQKKKKKRNKKRKYKKIQQIATQPQIGNNVSYGTTFPSNNSSNLNTLIQSEQLKMLENKNNNVSNENNSQYLELKNDVDNSKYLIDTMYKQGSNQFNNIKNSITQIYGKLGFDPDDGIDVPSTGGSDSFIPQGQKMSIIDYNLNESLPQIEENYEDDNDDISSSNNTSSNRPPSPRRNLFTPKFKSVQSPISKFFYGKKQSSQPEEKDDEPLSDLKPNKLKMVNENKSNARKQYMDALRELQQTENISYKEAQERYRQEKGKKL
jgi:hypothetical protein